MASCRIFAVCLHYNLLIENTLETQHATYMIDATAVDVVSRHVFILEECSMHVRIAGGASGALTQNLLL